MKANKRTTAKPEFILIGECDMLRKFANNPSKRKGSKYYCFPFTFRDPITDKCKHSQITTGESDYERAKKRRDELKDEVRKNLSREEVSHSDKQPIGEFFDYFLKVKGQDGLQKNTLYDYSLKIQTFVKWADPDLPLCKVTPYILRNFFAQIESESLRSLIRRILNSAFNFAILEEKLDKNPLLNVRRLKQTEIIPEYLPEPEFIKLYRRMPEDTYIQKSSKFASLLSIATGVRIGELCHIRLNAIRWDNKELYIKNSEIFRTKNGSERILPITPRVREALQRQLQNKAQHPLELVRESPYLFANEVGKAYMGEKHKSCKLSKLFKEIAREVFPDRPKLHFHSLRHSFGQNAYNVGMPLVQISKIMGHKSLAVTAKYYARHSEYKKFDELYSYLENQPSLSESHFLDEVDGRQIAGNLTANELEQCAHLATTI